MLFPLEPVAMLLQCLVELSIILVAGVPLANKMIPLPFEHAVTKLYTPD